MSRSVRGPVVHSISGSIFALALLILAKWIGQLAEGSAMSLRDTVLPTARLWPLTFLVFLIAGLELRHRREKPSWRGIAFFALFGGVVDLLRELAGYHGWPGEIYDVSFVEALKRAASFAIAIFAVTAWAASFREEEDWSSPVNDTPPPPSPAAPRMPEETTGRGASPEDTSRLRFAIRSFLKPTVTCPVCSEKFSLLERQFAEDIECPACQSPLLVLRGHFLTVWRLSLALDAVLSYFAASSVLGFAGVFLILFVPVRAVVRVLVTYIWPPKLQFREETPLRIRRLGE